MTQTSFPKTEEQILGYWHDKGIFQKTLTKNALKGDFVFYDGPPFATGLPHYGHIIAGTIKDVIPRYKTMQGYHVERRWGWDCHGLPLENLIEQEKGIKDKKEIEADIAGFNKACREAVLRYAHEWRKSVDRTGRWVDMENDYKTMDNRYIEVIWWIFKELWKEGLIYEGYKAMHLCPRCETTLSNFEVTLGYKDVEDMAVYVKFELKSQISNLKTITQNSKVYMLAWTTTPWTLPGNMALAVGEDIEYVIVQMQKSKIKMQNENVKVKNNEGEYYDEYYIVAKDRIEAVFKDEEYEVVNTIKGKELIGLEHEPLFDFIVSEIKNKNFGTHVASHPHIQNAFKVYGADFVSTEEGTGIVHIAPAFGSDDYNLFREKHLPFIQHVRKNGKFKFYVQFAPGLVIKTKDDPHAGDVAVLKYLNEHGLLFKKEKYAHSYPHCWRCDTPLINYAASSWFVKVTAIKDRLLSANSKVNWIPEHIKDGRFGKWLEGAKDWAISRSRYWGAPLPVWRCESCKEIAVIGSVQELNEKQNKTPEKSEVLYHPAEDLGSVGAKRNWHLAHSIVDTEIVVKEDNKKEKALAGGLEPPRDEMPVSLAHHAANARLLYHQIKEGAIDIHRPYIDKITFPCNKCGGTMHRVSEVFDCWFESGAMPYASEIMFSDYTITPDTTREELKKHINFPADFIAEGIDQTRGWFYTLMVLGVALYGESPFKNVIVNGVILAENGQKMSKRLKNYPDPIDIINKYGADALRFYLLSSPAVRGDALNFSEKGVDEVYKKVILLTLNVVNFWKMYDNNAKIKNQKSKIKFKIENCENVLDIWIVSELFYLTYPFVTNELNNYEIDHACRFILVFINDLSTWYVRRSRGRFKVEGDDQEAAIVTLQFVLLELSKLLAPITPFLAEYIYKEVGGEMESVHLEDWPENFVHKNYDEDVLNSMLVVQSVCELGHRLRDEAGIKVRQVLSKCYFTAHNFKSGNFNFISSDANYLEAYKKIISEELNVKEVKIVEELPRSEGWIFKDCVALYTVLDDSLKEEGVVRELTRQINNLRKKQGLTIQDKIKLEYSTRSDEMRALIEKHSETLKAATLANSIEYNEKEEGEQIVIDGTALAVALIK